MSDQSTNEKFDLENLTREKLDTMYQTGSLTPEDAAAAFFSLEQPRFKELINNMSLRELKRLIYQLVSYPLTEKQYAPQTDIERKAFYIGNEMVQNRAMMQLHLEMKKVEEAQALEDASQPTNQGENSNG